MFLVVYCLVNEWMQQVYGSPNLRRKRRGPHTGVHVR